MFVVPKFLKFKDEGSSRTIMFVPPLSDPQVCPKPTNLLEKWIGAKDFECLGYATISQDIKLNKFSKLVVVCSFPEHDGFSGTLMFVKLGFSIPEHDT